MEQIKTFEDAAQALGLDPNVLPVVEGLPEKHAKAIVSNYKLWIIAQALNAGWEPDWNDSNQWKYYPWFDMETYRDKSGAVVGSCFSFGGYVCGSSVTCVGSRLCFKTAALAKYAGTQFIELYRDVYVIEK